MIRRTVSVKRLSADLGRSSLEERATQKRRLSESHELAVATTILKGEASKFEGGRAETESGPTVTQAETAGQVTETVKTSISAVLFQKEKSGGLREEFEKVAEVMRVESRFFHVADEAIATALGIDTSSEGVTLLRSFDEKVVKFTGKIADELKSFLGDESFPLCGKIGPENYMKYQQRELPLVWVAVDFDDKENDDSTHGVIPMAREAAKEHKGKLSIVYIDGEKFKGHLENLGLSGDLPGIVVTDADKKFLYSGDHTEAAIKDFLSKYAAGSLEPFLKSQEPPATNDGPVTIVVGKTFDKLVIDNDKCVLVEFYATWCGHCKELEPKYEDLGERFQDNDNVVIAKMDTPENDTPIEVKGFPTIKLFLPGKKDSPMDYNKGRTAEDLEEFIKEHCPGVGDETEEEDEEEQDTGKEEL
eukprot:783109_1